jgi:hypothetical protein
MAQLYIAVPDKLAAACAAPGPFGLRRIDLALGA